MSSRLAQVLSDGVDRYPKFAAHRFGIVPNRKEPEYLTSAEA